MTILAGCFAGLWWSSNSSGFTCVVVIAAAGVVTPLGVWITEWIFEIDRTIPEPEPEPEWE